MLTDHKVRPYTEADLKRLAAGARSVLGVPEVGYFNVIGCLRTLQSSKPIKGELLRVRFFDSIAGQSPANVTYKPLTLEFDREAWELADLGDPWARYVAAHEICHIFVHDCDAQPYSGIVKKWIDFKEQSAEWQANTFADHFLVSYASIARFVFPKAIANNCFVERKVVLRRLGERTAPTGEYCPRCGGSEVYRSGTLEVCDDCGWASSC